MAAAAAVVSEPPRPPFAFAAPDNEAAFRTALAELATQRERGDDAAIARAAIDAAKAGANGGRHGEALALAQEAAAAAGRLADADLEAAAWVLVASESARTDRPRGAMQAISRVLGTLDRLADGAALMTAFSGIGFTYEALGMPRHALDAARRALALAHARNDAAGRLRTTLNLVNCGLEAWDLIAATDAAAAARLMDELRDHCAWLAPVTLELQRRGERGRAGYCRMHAALHRRQGDFAAARALLEEFLHPDWPGQPDLRAEMWLELALARRGSGAAPAAVAECVEQVQRALAALPTRSVHAAQLRQQALIEELSGRGEAALVLWQRWQQRRHAHVLEALEARVDELLATQSLRLENAQLRSQAQGLEESVRQLAHLAATDALTGLPNRRALASAFAQRAAEPFVLVLLDADHFKQVNDRHSHPVGDAVLRELARLMLATLGDGDAAGRYGGEEFALLLRSDARERVERLCAAVRSHDWPALSPGLAVTLSAGVVQVQPGDGFEAAIARADALLYRAKALGRDRVIVERQP